MTTDATGRPLHSWRTLILPYLDQRSLYNAIDLSKPWDDPANADALSKIPSVYRCPSFAGASPLTTYVAVVGPNAYLHPQNSRTLKRSLTKNRRRRWWSRRRRRRPSHGWHRKTEAPRFSPP